MNTLYETVLRKFIFLIFTGMLPLCGFILTPTPDLAGETIYVDIQQGNDRNPGTEEEPYRTIYHAVTRVNSASVGGPTTIKISPGVYNLDRRVLFGNNRPYTRSVDLLFSKESRAEIASQCSGDDVQVISGQIPAH